MVSETKRTGRWQCFCDWGWWEKIIVVLKKIISTILTLASLVLIVYAIAKGYSKLKQHLALEYLLLLFALILLAYVEGLLVATLELEHAELPTDDENFRKQYARALATLKLLKKNGVKKFLVGRQFCVVFIVFVVAKLTNFDFPKESLPEWLIFIIEIGLPGAFVVLAFGQLGPQLCAQKYPLKFMNMFFTWSIVQLALALEFIGILSFSWVWAAIVQRLMRWKEPKVEEAKEIKSSTSDVIEEKDMNDESEKMNHEDDSAFIDDESVSVETNGRPETLETSLLINDEEKA